MFERDVIISGAGPAGAICAAYLARAGADVLLIDKDIFPRDKVCGDVLREAAVKHIEALEAVAMLDDMSTCLRKVKVIAPGGSENIVPFEAYSLSRLRLDKLLVDTAVNWGAEFRQGYRVIDVIEEKGFIRGVVLQKGSELEEVRCKMLVVAEGANSTTSEILGISDINEANSSNLRSEGGWIGRRAYYKGIKLDRALAVNQYEGYATVGFSVETVPGYFWIVPVGKEGIEKGICNVGMLVKDCGEYSMKKMEEAFENWKSSVPEICAMFEGAEITEPWAVGKLKTGRAEGTVTGNGYIVIGDAASRMAPLYNDGITAAADSAKAAAVAVRSGLDEAEFSEGFLKKIYEDTIQLVDRNAMGTDALKEMELLIESMYDPRVIDKMILSR